MGGLQVPSPLPSFRRGSVQASCSTNKTKITWHLPWLVPCEVSSNNFTLYFQPWQCKLTTLGFIVILHVHDKKKIHADAPWHAKDSKFIVIYEECTHKNWHALTSKSFKNIKSPASCVIGWNQYQIILFIPYCKSIPLLQTQLWQNWSSLQHFSLQNFLLWNPKFYKCKRRSFVQDCSKTLRELTVNVSIFC